MDNQTPDLAGILAKLSENPAVMTALLGALGTAKPAQPPPPPPENNSGIDLQKILSQLNFGGTMATNSPENGGGQGFGQPLLPPAERLLGSREDSINRVNLLNALRPYLNENRRQKLDLVIKLLKLTELGELGSLLKNLI